MFSVKVGPVLLETVYVQSLPLFCVSEVVLVLVGSLVMDHPGSGPSPILGKPLLFGTVHGAIGLVGQLAPDTYTILSKLQENVAKVITSVGHINHEVYPLICIHVQYV